MAVDQKRPAELPVGALDQRFEPGVIRAVQRRDPRQPFVDRQQLFVDRLRIADHARNRAQPDGDAQRPGVGEIGQRTLEDLRIEFVGLAIDVEIGARKHGPHQRRAQSDARQEQFVDEGVLRTAQGQRVESGRFEKPVRIAQPRMGRAEDKRRGQTRRLDRLHRGIESDQFGPLQLVHNRSATNGALALSAAIGFIIWDALGDGAGIRDVFQGIFTGAP